MGNRGFTKKHDQEGKRLYNRKMKKFVQQVLEDHDLADITRSRCRPLTGCAAHVYQYRRYGWAQNYALQFDPGWLNCLYWLGYERTLGNENSSQSKIKLIRMFELSALSDTSFTKLSRDECLKFLALHEIAHVITWSYVGKYITAREEAERGGHNEIWAHILKKLVDKYLTKPRRSGILSWLKLKLKERKDE